MPTPRVYCDTSVFGGCFDEEFEEASNRLFDQFRAGAFRLVLSQTTLDELDPSPSRVQALLQTIPVENLEFVPPSREIEELRDAYIAAGVIGRASIGDAAHIAAASVARVDMIVSWNFSHIVHFEKIRGYHGVNIMRGYFSVPIFSPPEVV